MSLSPKQHTFNIHLPNGFVKMTYALENISSLISPCLLNFLAPIYPFN